MKLYIPLFCAATIFAAYFARAFNVSNTVLQVDQHGNLNVPGIASVQDVATNSVKAQIAEAKAQAAQETAAGVTSAIGGVVANIMSNNVVIYRSGFIDGFAPLVLFTENDWMKIINFTLIQQTASAIIVDISFVFTANLGSIKPIVYANNTLTNKANFTQVADANVTTPVYTADQVTINNQEFSGYYTIRVTIDNPTNASSYFYWVEIDGDHPMGDGAGLELANGVTGGISGDVTFGDKVITFVGGLGKAVRDAE